MNLIEMTNISKKYEKKQALDNINITIESGKIYGLLGPNGSGKTTLIKIINDLLTPTSGEVFIKGKKPGIESKKIISYLPERTYLNMNFKVKEILDYFEDFYENFDRKKAQDLLKKLNINEQDKLKTMSKGTKEKVQLILVMSRKADLYILDEPIGGVEPAIIVKNGKTELIKDTDYSVEYKNNTEVGTATAVIKGDGVSYIGTRNISFKITGTPITKATVEGITPKMPYTGNDITFDEIKFSTTDENEIIEWAKKMYQKGYDVEFYYDEATGTFSGIATKK